MFLSENFGENSKKENLDSFQNSLNFMHKSKDKNILCHWKFNKFEKPEEVGEIQEANSSLSPPVENAASRIPSWRLSQRIGKNSDSPNILYIFSISAKLILISDL